MRRLLFWTALPFVLPQALIVRKTARRFAAATGPEHGAVGCGKSFKVLAIGDSIIAGVGATTLVNALVGQVASALAKPLAARVEWQALGLIGADVRQILHELITKLPQEPADAIFVSAGVNDVTGLTRTRAWQRHLAALLQALHAHSPQAAIVILGLPPMQRFPLLPQPLRTVIGLRAAILDQVAIREIALHPHAMHLPLKFEARPQDFSGDGYHPSEQSYAVLGLWVADAILALKAAQAQSKPSGINE